VFGNEDVHLLNWFLVGDCDCFNEKVEKRYQAVWDCIKDEEKLQMMAASPVHAFVCRTLDELGPWEPGVSHLLMTDETDPLRILHSVMLPVTTDERVLSRGRRGGQFTKFGPGGGETNKSMMHLHFACWNGLFDEMGIKFNNSAILDVSPPIIEIGPVHPADRRKMSKDESYSAVYIQYCLLDENQIELLPKEVFLGGNVDPATYSKGTWGHYKVGGDELRSEEIIRLIQMLPSVWSHWKDSGRKCTTMSVREVRNREVGE
jgi:hypothetical protein